MKNNNKRSKIHNHIVEAQERPVIYIFIIVGESRRQGFENNTCNELNENNFDLLYSGNKDEIYIQMYYGMWYLINID